MFVYIFVELLLTIIKTQVPVSATVRSSVQRLGSLVSITIPLILFNPLFSHPSELLSPPLDLFLVDLSSLVSL